MNRLLLQARVLELGAMRYTPAGLPVIDLSLKHESKLLEAEHLRGVSLELRAVAVGDIALQLNRIEIGAQASFAGFIASGRNGRGVVFHVTELG